MTDGAVICLTINASGGGGMAMKTAHLFRSTLPTAGVLEPPISSRLRGSFQSYCPMVAKWVGGRSVLSQTFPMRLFANRSPLTPRARGEGGGVSGGSWDYFYCRLEEVADRLIEEPGIERKAFGRHLRKCAAALKAIEWVDSCDSSSPHDTDAIRKAIGEGLNGAIAEEAHALACSTLEVVRDALVRLAARPAQEKGAKD